MRRLDIQATLPIFEASAAVDEQRAIAHILGTLDDKIELNRRMNETLEAMARALFKSWFVDFDPVRAKAEGRDPGLPKHIADLFPDRFEDSELGRDSGGVGSRSDSQTRKAAEWWHAEDRPQRISGRRHYHGPAPKMFRSVAKHF